MPQLTIRERDSLARVLRDRKQTMREEIAAGLAGMREETYEDLLSGTSDAGDESLATLITDVANAEVVRDAAELRDILAAEMRIAAGTYGICIDCAEPIPYVRLIAYPTAKRCIHCQQVREATHATAGQR